MEIQNNEKEVTVKMKQLAVDEKWNILAKYIEFVKNYGSKRFNNNLEKYLKDENYTDANSWDKTNQGEALRAINREHERYKNGINKLNEQNQT